MNSKRRYYVMVATGLQSEFEILMFLVLNLSPLGNYGLSGHSFQPFTRCGRLKILFTAIVLVVFSWNFLPNCFTAFLAHLRASCVSTFEFDVVKEFAG